MQIDMNIKFEYNAITEGGSELKPVMGPGKVGISNLGNYCYMSSILQALWAIPAFGHTFTGPDRRSVLKSAPPDIANDFPAQFAKVGSAIVSGACTIVYILQSMYYSVYYSQQPSLLIMQCVIKKL